MKRHTFKLSFINLPTLLDFLLLALVIFVFLSHAQFPKTQAEWENLQHLWYKITTFNPMAHHDSCSKYNGNIKLCVESQQSGAKCNWFADCSVCSSGKNPESVCKNK